MSDELKPVRCGCGGKSQVFFPFTNNSVYMIECKKCGICTSAYETEAEAIQAWNTAMGERTANVENQHYDYSPYAFDFMGKCENCGETVRLGEKFCHECGAKLVWK